MYHFMSGTRVVAYAWNADIVCVPCVTERLAATLRDEVGEAGGLTAERLDELGADELRELYCELILEKPVSAIDELDTGEMPQPVFASDEGGLEDSCGSCLERISDTL